MPGPLGSLSRRRRWLPLILLVSYLLLNLGGWWYYRRAEANLVSAVGSRLLAETELVAGQIDTTLLAATTDSAFDADAYLTLYGIVTEAASRGRFASLFLLTPEGSDWLAPDDDSVAAERALFVAAAGDAFATAAVGVAATSELYESRGAYFLAACVPVVDAEGETQAVVAAEAGNDYFVALEDLSRGLLLLDLFAGLVLLLAGVVWAAAQRRLGRAEQAAIRSAQLAAMGQMVATVAHELKNPLGIIKNSAERIRKKYGKAEEPLFNFIPEEVDRLDELLRRYLQFARLEVGRPEPVALAPLVAKTVEYEPGGEANAAPVAVHIDDELAVRGDAAALQQVILNLTLNAREACRRKGSGGVSIGAKRNGARVEIEIADTGSGMDAETLRHTAEPFFTTRPDGSGLGVYLAKTLTEKMSGTMTIQSRVGEGTRVKIELPAAEKE